MWLVSRWSCVVGRVRLLRRQKCRWSCMRIVKTAQHLMSACAPVTAPLNHWAASNMCSRVCHAPPPSPSPNARLTYLNQRDTRYRSACGVGERTDRGPAAERVKLRSLGYCCRREGRMKRAGPSHAEEEEGELASARAAPGEQAPGLSATRPLRLRLAQGWLLTEAEMMPAEPVVHPG